MDLPNTPTQAAQPEGHGDLGPGSASIILVRFKSRRAAERMVASLGRAFERAHTRAGRQRSSSLIIAMAHSNSSSPAY